MNVAYVLKVYPRLSQTFILNEILAHQDAGRPVDIFSLRRPRDEPRHAAVARVERDPVYFDLPRSRSRIPADVAEQARGVAAEAKRRGVDHLHAHFGNVAAEVARQAAAIGGISYSFTAHARDIFHESVRKEELRRKLDEASFVVTVSSFNREYLRRTYGAAAARVERLYNGLDLEAYAFSDAPRPRARLLAVGRLVPKKGFVDLIEACRLLRPTTPDLRCEVIGSGPLEDELRGQVAAAGLQEHVRFSGPRSADQVAAAMREATALVAPCVETADGDRDGLPTVLLEAMALGTPCISTDVSGIPEILRDGETGLAVPQRAPSSLAEACGRLISDPPLQRNLAQAARRLVTNQFDAGVNTARLRERFVEAIADRRAIP